MIGSIFLGPGLAGIAALAVCAFVVARRRPSIPLAVAVGADVLTWSWISGLKTTGNIVYWGVASGLGLYLLDCARSSRLARWLVAAAVLVTVILTATSAWSIAPHETLRESVTFGSVLVVVAVAVIELRRGGGERLLEALAVLVPAELLLTLVVIVGDHAHAVAEGGGVSGFVNGANAFGVILALQMPFLVAARRVRGNLILLAVSVALVTFVVTLSGSRTGLLALVAGAAAVELGRRRWASLATTVVVALAAATLAVLWTPPIATLGRPILTNKAQAHGSQIFGGDRGRDQSRFGALVGGRDEAWRVAGDLLSREPLHGTGFGTGSEIFEHYGVRHRFTNFVGAFDPTANVHEAYLQELLELGFPLGLLFFVLPAAAFVAATRRLFSVWPTDIDAALGGAVFAAVAAGLFESVFAGFGSMTLLAWLATCGVLLRGAPWVEGRRVRVLAPAAPSP
jgi:O-antigen ligase